MKAFIYVKNNEVVERRLREALKDIQIDGDVLFLNNINSFLDSLRQYAGGTRIAIIHIDHRRDLDEFIALKNIIRRLWTILVLPDRNPEIVTQAHILWPRVITDVNSDLLEIRAVLEKMNQTRQTIPRIAAGIA